MVWVSEKHSFGKIHLGWLDSKRDWGYVKEYVQAIWLMLQADAPKDYVIGTNTLPTVRDVCKIAFAHVGLNWEDHIETTDRLLRPTEIKDLKGDFSLAKKDLGWEPKTYLDQLIPLMVDADLERFR